MMGFMIWPLTNEFTNNRVYLNNGNENNWIKIALQGVISNRDGIGSWMEVYSGSNTYYRYTQAGDSYGSQSSFDYIIGLGLGSAIDSIRIKWPSGITDKLYNVNVNQRITVLEGTENCDI